MINKLSKEQQEQLTIYKDRYINIGTDVTPIDRNLAINFSNWLYSVFKRKKPINIFMDGPISSWYAVLLLNQVGDQVRNQVGNQVRDQVWDQVRDQVWDQVRDQVGNQVRNQVGNQVRDRVWDRVWDQVRDQVWDQVQSQVGNQVRNQVGDQVRNQVGNQVWNQVGNQVGNQVWDQVRDQVRNFIWPYLTGQFDSSFFSFYDYMHEVLNVDLAMPEYFNLRKSINFNLIYPLKQFCIFSEKPVSINRNERGLHKDGKTALEYKDGTKIWALNGVKVSQEIAESPASILSPKIILTEQNVEVRREIVKKIGINRIFKDLSGNVIESYNGYELINIDLQDERIRPFLKMTNPSTNDIHIEGVHPSCNTIKKALAWRNGINGKWIEPDQLT